MTDSQYPSSQAEPKLLSAAELRRVVENVRTISTNAKAAGCVYAYGAGNETGALCYDDVIAVCDAASRPSLEAEPDEATFCRYDGSPLELMCRGCGAAALAARKQRTT